MENRKFQIRNQHHLAWLLQSLQKSSEDEKMGDELYVHGRDLWGRGGWQVDYAVAMSPHQVWKRGGKEKRKRKNSNKIFS